MRDCQIQISGISLLSVVSVEMYKCVNEHGFIKIKGTIEDKNEATFIQKFTQEEHARVDIVDEEGSSCTIFCGVVTQLEVKSAGYEKTIEIEIMGATFLMDCSANTKSFQDKSMTYDAIFDVIDAKYIGARCMTQEGNKEIGDVIVQYKESDWEFAKRLASHFNQPIVPLWKSGKIVYSVGIVESSMVSAIKEEHYKVNTRKSDYYFNKENGLDEYSMEDAKSYEIVSRDFVELGDAVAFHGKTLYVYEIKSKYVGEELLHTYSLRTESGFKLVKRFNMSLIGASLDASILSVQKDTVKIHISVDASQDEGSAKWFPYSTVYSSADGTGWYCMPEPGDKVRLYFPNEKEAEGYVISSINVGGSEGASSGGTQGGAAGGSAPRNNPDNKSISNKYNKQIELTPTSITMTNNAGLSVCLDDEEGITIVSNKKVSIIADEDIMMVSSAGQLNVMASDSIVLSQGTSKMTLQDDVILEGAKFLVQ